LTIFSFTFFVQLNLEARARGYWLDDALIEIVRRLTGE
jgi:hypothetical protein